MNAMSIFSDNLRKYREKTGKQAKEFAKEIDVLYSTYANYEQGRSEPKIDTLIKIADCLNISIDTLLGYIPQRASNEYEYYKQWLSSTDAIKINDNDNLIYITFENMDTNKFVVGAVKETYLLSVEKKETLITIAKYIESGIIERQEVAKYLDITEYFSFIINMVLMRTNIKAKISNEFKDIINSINIIDVNSERIYNIDQYIQEHCIKKNPPPSEVGEGLDLVEK